MCVSKLKCGMTYDGVPVAILEATLVMGSVQNAANTIVRYALQSSRLTEDQRDELSTALNFLSEVGANARARWED